MNINFNQMNKDKVMRDLSAFIDKLISEKDSLSEIVRNYNKDEHIEKLIEENTKLRIHSLHTLSEKEKEQADVFRKKHWESCKGNTRYILEGTGIGTAVGVQCTKCGVKKDITDTSNW